MTTLTKVQLVAFTIITIFCVVYGSVRFLGVRDLVDRPYTIEAEFAQTGGLYPRADVELLGTRVGKVEDIRPGPDGGSIVVLAIDQDTQIPREVRAKVGNKSAIGEPYIELTPQVADGPVLEAGDRIPRERTSSTLPVERLIGGLDALVRSVPADDLAVALEELARASEGLAGPLGRLIDASDRLTAASLANVDSTTALIQDARVVLDTQAELSVQTATALEQLAGLTGTLRALDADVAALFADGVRAGTEVTNLLAANQDALPLLLNDLLSLTTVVGDRLPAVRKTLVVFPWLLELGGTTVRYCEDVDAETGRPVEATCDYDENGDPVWKAWLAQQIDQGPGSPPYHSCARGYESTNRFHPDGTPMDGTDQHAGADEEPNLLADCAASAADPSSPNVRGARNVPDYLAPTGPGARRVAPGWAAYDGDTGLLVTPEGTFRLIGRTGPPPPSGNDGLAWLLSRSLQNGS